ncbi:hypothetical protein [Paraburkholderia sediminicola]|uniref:hypothetical protein n=1 Tax=Paraburkholderia sediminicola TaxID=458836 RepID=UPI0038B6E8BF
MRIFVDTEFTDFIDCDLISIALITDDGREFYAERTGFNRHACSGFVREAVRPQLGQYPQRMFSRSSLHSALHDWLGQFGGGTFCMDFHGDWDLLADLLDAVPDGWEALLVWDQADKARLEPYSQQFGGRYHALHDARALRYAMQGNIPPPTATDVAP